MIVEVQMSKDYERAYERAFWTRSWSLRPFHRRHVQMGIRPPRPDEEWAPNGPMLVPLVPVR